MSRYALLVTRKIRPEAEAVCAHRAGPPARSTATLLTEVSRRRARLCLPGPAGRRPGRSPQPRSLPRRSGGRCLRAIRSGDVLQAGFQGAGPADNAGRKKPEWQVRQVRQRGARPAAGPLGPCHRSGCVASAASGRRGCHPDTRLRRPLVRIHAAGGAIVTP